MATSTTPSIKASTDCHFFLNGGCMKGPSCEFRHSETALKSDTICLYWQKGTCKNGPACSYRHPTPSVTSTVAPTAFKGRVAAPSSSKCVFFLKGNCTKGEACPYEHDVAPPPKSIDVPIPAPSKPSIFSRLGGKVEEAPAPTKKSILSRLKGDVKDAKMESDPIVAAKAAEILGKRKLSGAGDRNMQQKKVKKQEEKSAKGKKQDTKESPPQPQVTQRTAPVVTAPPSKVIPREPIKIPAVPVVQEHKEVIKPTVNAVQSQVVSAPSPSAEGSSSPTPAVKLTRDQLAAEKRKKMLDDQLALKGRKGRNPPSPPPTPAVVPPKPDAVNFDDSDDDMEDWM